MYAVRCATDYNARWLLRAIARSWPKALFQHLSLGGVARKLAKKAITCSRICLTP